MAPIDSLLTLLMEQLGQLYDAEQRWMKALPNLADAVSSVDLMRQIESNVSSTETHVSRLDQAFAALEEKNDQRPCAGMSLLISAAERCAADEYKKGKLRDAAIITAARQIEHYQIAAYSSAICHAWALDEDEVATLLEATLEEEKAADRNLRKIALRLVFPRNVRASAATGSIPARH